MRPDLKLYIWRDVLTDWSSGIVFVLAPSVEAARNAVRIECRLRDPQWHTREAPRVYKQTGVEPFPTPEQIAFPTPGQPFPLPPEHWQGMRPVYGWTENPNYPSCDGWECALLEEAISGEPEIHEGVFADWIEGGS